MWQEYRKCLDVGPLQVHEILRRGMVSGCPPSRVWSYVLTLKLIGNLWGDAWKTRHYQAPLSDFTPCLTSSYIVHW